MREGERAGTSDCRARAQEETADGGETTDTDDVVVGNLSAHIDKHSLAKLGSPHRSKDIFHGFAINGVSCEAEQN